MNVNSWLGDISCKVYSDSPEYLKEKVRQLKESLYDEQMAHEMTRRQLHSVETNLSKWVKRG